MKEYNIQIGEVFTEEKAKELLRIGDPFAFRIFGEIDTEEKLLNLGDDLLRSGRINDALSAYTTSGINVSQIDKEKPTEEIINDIEKSKLSRK